MTKSDSVSIYRRFSAPLRGKFLAVVYGVGPQPVYRIIVTSRNDVVFKYGDVIDVIGSDIYDAHRIDSKGRIVFTGKTWMDRSDVRYFTN